ncbi:NADP oxidoreductase [Thioalkalicoccus limnaeus]|uniref:NADP oxidoreductase n=1 Tax=Thioalkalicoccus limnaeus TaxID=120681 RepID=A0ABV4BIA8_9GAMM
MSSTSASPKIRVATTWLDGCSGCHMSFLDLDERLFELAQRVEMVHGPLVDTKSLPERVDIGIIEGSISTEEDLVKARAFRRRCTRLVSLGDCAVNGNVPALRNRFPLAEVTDRAFRETVTLQPMVPSQGVPKLLKMVLPVHGVVAVDVYIPGCPPSADTIWYVLSELFAGRAPNPSEVTRFGA